MWPEDIWDEGGRSVWGAVMEVVMGKGTAVGF